MCGVTALYCVIERMFVNTEDDFSVQNVEG